MNRRILLKSALGVTLFSLGGVSAYQIYRQSLNQRTVFTEQSLSFLTNDDVIALQALIPILLATRLTESNISMAQIVSNMDAAIIRLSLSTV